MSGSGVLVVPEKVEAVMSWGRPKFVFDVTPQNRGSVDNLSTRGILVDVGLPEHHSRKSGRVSFVRGALPKVQPITIINNDHTGSICK